ncbi:hypothetical protein LTR84_008842 [Exophiala bonariae]|uniref:Transcription factor domain-containing protein n=1 Tax=Exophiala bonariae TaxID=1690606 RepID=A0AAV9MYU2_9EURO|nr:hypothetical protein LTR84_008842 [Exophiala bonariae]
MHIAALDKFLELRGGNLSVELYGMLLRLSIWCDINPPLTVPSAPSPRPLDATNSHVELHVRQWGYTPFATDIFEDIRKLVALREEFCSEPEPREKRRERNFAYHKFVSRCLRRTSRSLPQVLAVNTAETIVLRSIRLGQILFMYTISPAMSVSGVYSRSIAEALRLSLEQPSPQNGDSLYWSPEVLCWLLFNGAITIQTKATQQWYFRRVREFLRSQCISYFNQVENLLRKVCWYEDQFGTACRTLFRDLVRAAGSEAAKTGPL